MSRERWIQAAVGVGLAAALLVPGVAGAQGWFKLPNGALAYATDYTTSGIFTCGNPRYIVGTCLALGNTVTITQGGSSAIFTFHGVSQTLTAPSSHALPVALGTLTASFVGTPFLPAMKNNAARTLYLDINLAATGPPASTGSFVFGFLSRPTGFIGYTWNTRNIMRLSPAPPPPPATYGMLAVYTPTTPVFTFDDLEWEMSARASVTPEPATLILLATGLAGVAGAAHRRRRRSRERND